MSNGKRPELPSATGDPQSSSGCPGATPRPQGQEIQPATDGSRSSSGTTPIPQRRKVSVETLEAKRLEERKNVQSYRARCTADKTEMFQTLGFYIVFQGVVFNTVSTSVNLKCETSLLPAVLSLIVSVGTWFSVLYKITDYTEDRKRLINSENLLKKVMAKKSLLEDHENFDFQELDEEYNQKRDKKIKEDEGNSVKFKWTIMSFLIIFSIAILGCCIIMRCWDLQHNKLMLCLFTVCWEKNVTVSTHSF